MLEKLKELGWGLLGIIFMVALIILGGLFIYGGVWISDKVYPWLIPISAIALGVSIFIFLPLGIFRKTRAFAGNGLFIASYVFGATLFVWSLLVAYQLLGVVGILIGLALAGVGVVPVAMFGTIINGLWSLLLELLLITGFTFGTRILGAYLVEKATPKEALWPE
jgi:hypothetical protein